MAAHQDDELGVLRARAYSLDGDIGDDAEAMQRLRKLESREQPRISAGAQPGDAIPAILRVSASAAISEGLDSKVLGPALHPSVYPRPRWQLPTLWISSVLVAVIITALVSVSMIPRPQIGSDAVGAT